MEELPRLFARQRDATPTATIVVLNDSQEDVSVEAESQQEQEPQNDAPRLGFYEDVHGQPMPDIRLPSDGPRAGCSFHESVFGRPMPEVHLPSDISRADPETALSRQERRFYRRSKELMEQIAELSQGDIVQELKGHYENMQNQQAHFAERCSRLPGDPCLTNNRMKSHNAAAAAAIYNYKGNSGM